MLTVALANQEMCAIPMLEMKTQKTGDAMAMRLGPNPDSASVMAPPVPACKHWNK
jgi:hypothetical protein